MFAITVKEYDAHLPSVSVSPVPGDGLSLLATGRVLETLLVSSAIRLVTEGVTSEINPTHVSPEGRVCVPCPILFPLSQLPRNVLPSENL